LLELQDYDDNKEFLTLITISNLYENQLINL